MIISIPTVRKRHFKEMMAIYDAIAAAYNKGVKNERDAGDYTRNPLRSAHREVYIQLLNFLAVALEQDYLKLQYDRVRLSILKRNIDDPIKISTNRPQLSNRTKKSESSIYRLLKRLELAGVLSKIPHGSQVNFELVFNQEMVLISDEANPNFLPEIYLIQHAKNQIIADSLRSICTLYNNTKTIKNIVIQEQHKVSSFQTTVKTNLQGTFYKNTRSPERGESGKDGIPAAVSTKINEFLETVPTSRTNSVKQEVKNAFGVVINTIERNMPAEGKTIENAPKINEFEECNSDYAKRLQDAEAAYQKRLKYNIDRFLSYLITILYLQLGRKVYDGEKLNAQTIAALYFETEARNSSKACDIRFEQLKRRINLVRRQIDVGKYNLHIGPAWYINPDNPTGFRRTLKWLKDDAKYKELQRFNRLRNTNESKLQAALENVYRLNNMAAYHSGVDYLRKKAPKMLETFEIQAMTYFELQSNNEVNL